MNAFKKAVCIIVAVAMAMTSLAGCGKEKLTAAVKHFEFPEHKGDGTDLVAENGKYRLILNPNTLEFAVEDTLLGKVWYSSPTFDPRYNGSEDELRALYTLTAKINGAEKIFNSYTNGTVNGNFEIATAKNGFQIKTSVGKNHEVTAADLPQAIEKSRFESIILSKLSTDESKELMLRYALFSVNDDSISDRKKEAALEKYPTLKEKDLYIINNGVPDYAAKKIKSYLDEIGYGNDEIVKDNSENGVETVPEEALLFDVEIGLSVTENGFDINVDCSRLTDFENPVTDISVLPYFDASYSDTDTGFLLLPDGSGSVVNINGSTSHYPNYSVKLYGEDKTVTKIQTGASTEAAVIPAFGMSKNSESFTAVIGEGDSAASVCMNLKGAQKVSSVYCAVSPALTADVDAGYTDSASGSLINMTQPETFKDSVRISYLLNGNGSTLGSMSQAVSEYMLDKGMIKKKKYQPRTRIELIGAIDRKTSILGIIPTSESVKITDFETAGKIADELHSDENGKLEFIYSGWCNGGMYTKALNNIKVEKVLGGKSGLKQLEEKISKNGDKLTLNLSLLTVADTSGFSSRRYAARALGNTVSRIYLYDLATGNAFKERTGTYIAPSYISDYANSIFKEIKGFTNAGIQIDDAGRILYSEMNNNSANTREDTKKSVISALSGQNGITVSTGNLYTLASAEYISDIPLDSSRYKREEYVVPFLQMVLRGTVGYASQPVNLSDNWKESVLRAASFGADVTFTVGSADKDTYYDTYFSDYAVTSFDNWKNTIKDTAKRMKKLSQALSDSRITEYVSISDGVYVSYYENGACVAANYNKESVKTDYGEINPQDWLLITKGEAK